MAGHTGGTVHPVGNPSMEPSAYEVRGHRLHPFPPGHAAAEPAYPPVARPVATPAPVGDAHRRDSGLGGALPDRLRRPPRVLPRAVGGRQSVAGRSRARGADRRHGGTRFGPNRRRCRSAASPCVATTRILDRYAGRFHGHLVPAPRPRPDPAAGFPHRRDRARTNRIGARVPTGTAQHGRVVLVRRR